MDRAYQARPLALPVQPVFRILTSACSSRRLTEAYRLAR
jgi:hypothetical protein